MHELTMYLRSWSSVQRYVQKHVTNPVDLIKEELQGAWGDPMQKRTVRWTLFSKIGLKA